VALLNDVQFVKKVTTFEMDALARGTIERLRR
jgi:hypothetical protein